MLYLAWSVYYDYRRRERALDTEKEQALWEPLSSQGVTIFEVLIYFVT